MRIVGLRQKEWRSLASLAGQPTWRSRQARLRRDFSAVLLAITLQVFLAGLVAAQPTDQQAVRQAFMLGADYGNGTQLYFRSPKMSADVRSAVERYMQDAADSARQLGIPFDPNLPTVDLTQPNPGIAIYARSNERAGTMRIAIDARWSGRAAAAFGLGYRAMIATEFVPIISPERREKEIRLLRQLGAEAGLPPGVLEPYLLVLAASGDRQEVVLAAYDFRKRVVSQFEAAVPMTANQARLMLNVWLTGTQVSLAALGQAHGAEQSTVQGLFTEARERARTFDAQIPSLPRADSKDPRNLAHVLHYLMNEVGDPVGEDLARRHGDRYSALFNLAIKSTMAMLLYGPDTGSGDMTESLVSTIERSAIAAQVPPEVWRTLVQKMKARSSFADVKSEITRMHTSVEDYYRRLATPAASGPLPPPVTAKPSLPSPAPTGSPLTEGVVIEICNKSSQTPYVALGYRTGTTWSATGWWKIAPGQCVVTHVEARLTGHIYAYGTTNTSGSGMTWTPDRDKAKFCVNIRDAFTLVDGRCDKPDHADLRWATFGVIYEGSSGKYTWTLTN